MIKIANKDILDCTEAEVIDYVENLDREKLEELAILMLGYYAGTQAVKRFSEGA
jgi:hypothetical protein